MCSLCGVLGGELHWSDRASNTAAFGGAVQGARRRERLHRVALANRVLAHYGLKLADWHGTSYTLRAATGRSAMVEHLPSLWQTAETLAGRSCDPLDPALLARLERS